MSLSPGNCYELFHLGLWWLSKNRDDGDVRPRSFSPMLYTLRDMGKLSEPERKLIIRRKNWELVPRLVRATTIIKMHPGQTYPEALDGHIEPAFKTLILALRPDDLFNKDRFIGKGGYKFQLTKAGREYAEKKEAPYASLSITEKGFVEAWLTMRERVKQIMCAAYRREQMPHVEPEYEGFDESEFDD